MIIGSSLGMMSGALVIGSPTTWNPSDKGSDVVLTGGNLAVSFSAANNTVVRSIFGFNIALAVGYYWETSITGSAGASNAFVGIATGTHTLTTNQLGFDTDAGDDGWTYLSLAGEKYNDNTLTAYGAAYTTSDVIGVAVKSGSIWFRKNGTWQNSGDPVAGTGAAFTGMTGTVYAGYSTNATAWTSTTNFGATAFSGSVPTGFYPGLGT